MVCGLQQKFQIIAMTLGLMVNVTYTYNLSMARNANPYFLFGGMEGINVQQQNDYLWCIRVLDCRYDI